MFFFLFVTRHKCLKGDEGTEQQVYVLERISNSAKQKFFKND